MTISSGPRIWFRTPFDPPGSTKEAFAAITGPAVFQLSAHASPIQLRFCNGTAFPEDYCGEVFVTLHGSRNRNPPTGHGVVRPRFLRRASPKGT